MLGPEAAAARSHPRVRARSAPIPHRPVTLGRSTQRCATGCGPLRQRVAADVRVTDCDPRCIGCPASVSLKRRNGLRCPSACSSARPRRPSPHGSAKACMTSKASEDSIASMGSQRPSSPGSSSPSSSTPDSVRTRIRPDSRFSQWRLCPSGSRQFSAKTSSSRSMSSVRRSAGPSSCLRSFALIARCRARPTGTGRTRSSDPARPTAGVRRPRTRVAAP